MTVGSLVQIVCRNCSRVCFVPYRDFVAHAGYSFPGGKCSTSKIYPAPLTVLVPVWVVTASSAWLDKTYRFFFNCCVCDCWCSEACYVLHLFLFWFHFHMRLAVIWFLPTVLLQFFLLDTWAVNMSRNHSFSWSSQSVCDAKWTKSAWNCSSVSFFVACGNWNYIVQKL